MARRLPWLPGVAGPRAGDLAAGSEESGGDSGRGSVVTPPPARTAGRSGVRWGGMGRFPDRPRSSAPGGGGGVGGAARCSFSSRGTGEVDPGLQDLDKVPPTAAVAPQNHPTLQTPTIRGTLVGEPSESLFLSYRLALPPPTPLFPAPSSVRPRPPLAAEARRVGSREGGRPGGDGEEEQEGFGGGGSPRQAGGGPGAPRRGRRAPPLPGRGGKAPPRPRGGPRSSSRGTQFPRIGQLTIHPALRPIAELRRLGSGRGARGAPPLGVRGRGPGGRGRAGRRAQREGELGRAHPDDSDRRAGQHRRAAPGGVPAAGAPPATTLDNRPPRPPRRPALSGRTCPSPSGPTPTPPTSPASSPTPAPPS